MHEAPYAFKWMEGRVRKHKRAYQAWNHVGSGHPEDSKVLEDIDGPHWLQLLQAVHHRTEHTALMDATPVQGNLRTITKDIV